MHQKRYSLILIFSFWALLACDSQLQEIDILIKGAFVHIGNGEAPSQMDVGVLGERIVFVGKNGVEKLKAKKVIEAEGYLLSPGFIDVHTHSIDDLLSEKAKSNLNFLKQGVTTLVTGNDGGGKINVGQMLAKMDTEGIGTNAALMVGHGQIRKQVMDMSDAEPTVAEMDQMKNILSQAMEEGAFGMSTGLYYTPGNFAKTDEVIELAKLAKEKGGIYDSHIRDESSYSIGLLEAIKEAIEIGRQSGIHINISHIKALGVDVWGKSEEIIGLIESAQQEGISISADQYPYRASGTSITNALVSRWVFADDFEANMKNSELLPRIKEEMADNLRRRGGPDALLFTDVKKKDLYGKTLEEVAEERGQAIIPAAYLIIMSGGSRVASFNMKPEDMHNFMQQDWVMTSSDGSTGHPRKFGSFPKKIREFVKEKKVLSLEEMIRKSTSLPAQIFQIQERGEIKEGYFADMILFKLEEIQDKATYAKPDILAEGIWTLLINGEIAIEKGKYTNTLGGKPLRMNKQ
ncbi:MAG: amidohydrolase family protein [Bacteroidia bacterium]|nr:amidohydrolase family protein [Bacteroidia bacterium]